MVAEPRRVHIEDIDNDIDALLDSADTGPVLIERHGAMYRVSRADDDIRSGYDAERALRALETAAGSWSDIDADALIAELYEAREVGSRPPDRP